MSGDCSLRDLVHFDCPECGAPVVVHAWVVIDGDNRPDLVAAAAEGRLNLGDCRSCGARTADVAMVIWRRDAVPPLLFVPCADRPRGDKERGIDLIERLVERAEQLGSALNTNRAVLAPPTALSWILTGHDQGVPGAGDAYDYYHRQVEAWIRDKEIDDAIALLHNAFTWNDLARVLGERPVLTDEVAIAELAARRAAAAGRGAHRITQRIDDYLEALGECGRLGVERAVAAHQPRDPLGPRHELILVIERLESTDSALSADERISLHRRVLVLLDPEDEPDLWRRFALRLASLLTDRRDGDISAHIEEALAVYEKILAQLGSADANPAEWAAVRNNQAGAYGRRVRGARGERIDRAIACYEEALAIFTRLGAMIAVAETRANLASALLSRPGRDRISDLVPAIDLLEDAVPRLEAADSDAVKSAHLNLANAYTRRAQPGDDERAFTHYRAAAAAYLRAGNPLRAAIAEISAAAAVEVDTPAGAERVIATIDDALRVLTRDAAPREWARAHLMKARVYRLSGATEDQVRSLRTCLEVCTPVDFPADCLEASTSLGNALTARAAGATGDVAAAWGDAADAYGVALHCADLLYAAAAEQRHRDDELIDRADLHHRAAFALARAGRAAEAGAALESGRARRLTEMLHGDAGEVASGRPDPEPGDAVVYLVVTGAGAEAVVVTSAGTEALALDGFTLDALTGLLFRRTAEGARGYLVGQEVGAGPLRAALARALPALGAAIMSPVADCLRRRGVGGVVLVPTGVLGLLPLHAACYPWDGHRTYFIDEFAVTYAPSAGALHVAQNRARAADLRSPLLVGLAEPLPSSPPLPYARAELDAVARHFVRVRRLVGGDASRVELLRALPEASHVLLACHGAFEASAPLASHLDLAGGDRLEVDELLRSRLFDGVRLVVASACQSAVPSAATLPDEYLGLASALLAAGAASVLGSLWPVYDLTTALIIDAFMRFHREGDPDLDLPPQPPAHALVHAQRWLRDVRAGELADHFDAQIDAPTAFGPGLRLSLAQTLDAAAYFSFLDRDRQPYADEPITWAGFVLVGAP